MAATPLATGAEAISFGRVAQVRTAVVVLAFVAAFQHVLLTMATRWQEPDWSHGWMIPLFSLWLVHLDWERIRRAPVRHCWVGLVLMLAGLTAYQLSLWLVVIGLIRPLSMLVCLAGVIIYLRGLPVLRYAWLPWLYLFFAVPLPKGIYFRLTDPLRRIAATTAAAVLDLIPGLDIRRVGSMIEYLSNGAYGQIGVADACSGMRSTMTLCALGVAVAFLSKRPWWQRIVMVATCVPIAVLCNAIRVTITCALYIFVDPKYASGNYHMALGLIMLLIAFGIFSGIGWVLNNLVVEERDAEARSA